MIRRAAGLAFAALLAAGCATIRPVAPSEAQEVRAGWEKARAAAYAPRRFKAMFKGDVSPTVGAAVHGYLLVWWDGTTLTWKASAPIAGNVRSGALTEGSDTGAAPFPGRLQPADAIGVVLGALDLSATARPVERVGDRYRLFLDGYGRAAVLAENMSVVALELPGPTRISYVPGAGLPHAIEAVSRDGRARLKLESLAPWPDGEAIPQG